MCWNSGIRGRLALLSLAALVALAGNPARANVLDDAKKLGKKIKDGAEDTYNKVKDGVTTAGQKIKDVLASDDGWDKSSGLCYQCADQDGKEIDVYQARATEGCSNPFKDGVTKKGKKVFKKACNNHDVCYAIPGTTRLRCDKKFLRDMNDICDDLSLKDVFKYTCHTAALSWYGAVRGFAQDAFKGGQKWGGDHCKKMKAKKCSGLWKRVP